eukprot:360103-Chlamydomonas_euryale.AAC.9
MSRPTGLHKETHGLAQTNALRANPAPTEPVGDTTHREVRRNTDLAQLLGGTPPPPAQSPGANLRRNPLTYLPGGTWRNALAEPGAMPWRNLAQCPGGTCGNSSMT